MLWGRLGAHVLIVAVSTLIVVNVYHLQRELGIRRGYAAFVTALMTVGAPLYVYSSMLFVEPIGGLFVIYALRVILAPRRTPLRLALASAGLGYLPLVHGRMTVFTIVLGVMLAIRVALDTRRRSAWPYVSALVPMTVLLAGIELFNGIRYGTVNPAPGNANNGDGLFQISPLDGALHLIFDGRFGLLPHFLILTLAVPGFLLTLRRGLGPVHLVLLATVLPYLLAISSFGIWWGGFSPPARFLAVVTPVLAYYVAVPLQRLHHWLFTSIAAATAGIAFGLSVASDVNPRTRFYAAPANGQQAMFAILAVGLVAVCLAILVIDKRKRLGINAHLAAPRAHQP
jgi:hypothetical protein